MKIICITDTHSGARQDNPHFYTYQKKFYDNVFFPYIDKHKPDALIHLGDIVENRKTMHYQTLTHLRDDFLKPIESFNNLESLWITGNHDTHYKNNLSINAMREFVDIQYSTVIDKPETYGGILFVPWICRDNREECEAAIHESTAEYCFGHFELKGFKDNNGNLSTYGDESTFLRSFRGVLSGHYHEPSRQGNVSYLGSPFEFIWSDYDGDRGFSMFDTDNGRLQFFRNPYHIFSTVDYTGGNTLNPGDEEKVRETYCRIFRKTGVGTDTDFDDFVKRIQDVGVIDLTIVENRDTPVMQISESVQIDNFKDIMLSYIDNQELQNPDIIKERFLQLYGRAQRNG